MSGPSKSPARHNPKDPGFTTSSHKGGTSGKSDAQNYYILTPSKLKELGFVTKVEDGKTLLIKPKDNPSILKHALNAQVERRKSCDSEPARPSAEGTYSVTTTESSPGRRRIIQGFSRHWAESLKKDGFIKCPLRLCTFISLRHEDMCTHYIICNGLANNTEFVCPTCKCCLKTRSDLELHIDRTHRDSTIELKIVGSPRAKQAPPVAAVVTAPLSDAQLIVRKRGYSKVHKQAWSIAVAEHGCVKCIFQNCIFMALSVDEMIEHYRCCNSKGLDKLVVCPHCRGGVSSQEKLDAHLSISHSGELDRPDSSNAETASAPCPVKKEPDALKGLVTKPHHEGSMQRWSSFHRSPALGLHTIDVAASKSQNSFKSLSPMPAASAQVCMFLKRRPHCEPVELFPPKVCTFLKKARLGDKRRRSDTEPGDGKRPRESSPSDGLVIDVDEAAQGVDYYVSDCGREVVYQEEVAEEPEYIISDMVADPQEVKEEIEYFDDVAARSEESDGKGAADVRFQAQHRERLQGKRKRKVRGRRESQGDVSRDDINIPTHDGTDCSRFAENFQLDQSPLQISDNFVSDPLASDLVERTDSGECDGFIAQSRSEIAGNDLVLSESVQFQVEMEFEADAEIGNKELCADSFEAGEGQQLTVPGALVFLEESGNMDSHNVDRGSNGSEHLSQSFQVAVKSSSKQSVGLGTLEVLVSEPRLSPDAASCPRPADSEPSELRDVGWMKIEPPDSAEIDNAPLSSADSNADSLGAATARLGPASRIDSPSPSRELPSSPIPEAPCGSVMVSNRIPEASFGSTTVLEGIPETSCGETMVPHGSMKAPEASVSEISSEQTSDFVETGDSAPQGKLAADHSEGASVLSSSSHDTTVCPAVVESAAAVRQDERQGDSVATSAERPDTLSRETICDSRSEPSVGASFGDSPSQPSVSASLGDSHSEPSVGASVGYSSLDAVAAGNGSRGNSAGAAAEGAAPYAEPCPSGLREARVHIQGSAEGEERGKSEKVKGEVQSAEDCGSNAGSRAVSDPSFLERGLIDDGNSTSAAEIPSAPDALPRISCERGPNGPGAEGTANAARGQDAGKGFSLGRLGNVKKPKPKRKASVIAPNSDSSDSPDSSITDMHETSIASENDLKENPNASEADVIRAPIVPETNINETPFVSKTDSYENPIAPNTDLKETPRALNTDSKENPFAPNTDSKENPIASKTHLKENPIAPITNSKGNPFAPNADLEENPIALNTDLEENLVISKTHLNENPFAQNTDSKETPIAPNTDFNENPKATKTDSNEDLNAPKAESNKTPPAPSALNATEALEAALARKQRGRHKRVSPTLPTHAQREVGGTAPATPGAKRGRRKKGALVVVVDQSTDPPIECSVTTPIGTPTPKKRGRPKKGTHVSTLNPVPTSNREADTVSAAGATTSRAEEMAVPRVPQGADGGGAAVTSASDASRDDSLAANVNPVLPVAQSKSLPASEPPRPKRGRRSNAEIAAAANALPADAAEPPKVRGRPRRAGTVPDTAATEALAPRKAARKRKLAVRESDDVDAASCGPAPEEPSSAEPFVPPRKRGRWATRSAAGEGDAAGAAVGADTASEVNSTWEANAAMGDNAPTEANAAMGDDAPTEANPAMGDDAPTEVAGIEELLPMEHFSHPGNVPRQTEKPCRGRKSALALYYELMERVRGKVALAEPIACGKCGAETSRKTFVTHNKTKHGGLGWIAGEIPVDMTNMEQVRYCLAKTFVRRGKMEITCEQCKVSKRSIEGFVAHLELYCQKSSAEQDAMRVACPVCLRVMLPTSLKVHMGVSHRSGLPQTPEPPPPPRTLGKRAAATKAAELIAYLKKEELDSRDAVPEDDDDAREQKHRELLRLYRKSGGPRKLNPLLLTRLRAELKTHGAMSCKNPDCVVTSNDIAVMQEHYVTCDKTPPLGFRCKRCGFRSDSEDAIQAHVLGHAVDEPREESSDTDFADNASASASEPDPEDRNDSRTPTNNRRSTLFLPSKGGRDLPGSELSLLRNARLSSRVKFLSREMSARVMGDSMYLPTAKWWLAFQKENFRAMSFPELVFRAEDLVLLDAAQAAAFLPTTGESVELAALSIGADGREDDAEWRKLARFQAAVVDGVPLLFTGGPVWALAWCPIPTDLLLERGNELSQFLAVTCHRDMDDKFTVGHGRLANGAIQVWDLGPLDHTSSPREPCLSFALAHGFGAVWHLEWCPSGCHDFSSSSSTGSLRRMGLLAAACSDGRAHVFAVPALEELPKGTSDGPRVLMLPPALTLVCGGARRPLPAQDTWMCSRVSWFKGAGHARMAGAFTNGMVAVWDLGATSALLTQQCGHTRFVFALRTFQAHMGSVTALSLFPYFEGRYLMTGGVDRLTKVWDLQQPAAPIASSFKGVVTDGVWLSHWVTTVTAYDDGFGIHHGNTMLHSVRNFGFNPYPLLPQNSPVWSVSGSEWSNAIAQGTAAGELCVIFPHQLFIGVDVEKSMKHKRKVISFVDLVEAGPAPAPTITAPTPPTPPGDSLDDKDAPSVASSSKPGSEIGSKLDSELGSKLGSELGSKAGSEQGSKPSSECAFDESRDVSAESESEDGSVVGRATRLEDKEFMSAKYDDIAQRFKLALCQYPVDNFRMFPSEARDSSRTSELMRSVPREMYPITSINRVSWNPNCSSHLWLATGYHCGLVRVPCIRGMQNAAFSRELFSEQNKKT